MISFATNNLAVGGEAALSPWGLVHAATDASHYAAAGAKVKVPGSGGTAQVHTRDEWGD
jgi:hypothetical protein